MRIYLLSHNKKGLFLAMGEDCLAASKALCDKTGTELEDWGVSGSWDVAEGSIINAGHFWPYFTNNPPPEYVKKDHDA